MAKALAMPSQDLPGVSFQVQDGQVHTQDGVGETATLAEGHSIGKSIALVILIDSNVGDSVSRVHGPIRLVRG